MSHFSVLVVTETARRAELDAALWPFHEFECTGEEQYIQDIDITEEARNEYQEATERRYRAADGVLHSAYDDRFYREPLASEKPGMGTGFGGGISWTSKDWQDGQGYRTKVHYLPDGYEEVEIAAQECESFAEWAAGWYGKEPLHIGAEPGEAHKYGHILLNEDGEVVRIIKRTNPNKQWDWWQVGGRYSNKLIAVWGQLCDHAQFGDIDHDAMRQRARQLRADCVAEAHAEVAKGRSEGQVRYLYGDRIFEPDYIDIEQPWTFAMLVNGAWLQRGEMGWWGIVSAEQAPEDWSEAYRIALAAIRPDQHVWIVDCHI